MNPITIWNNLSAWTRRIIVICGCVTIVTVIICLTVSGDLGAIIRLLVGP